MDVILFWQQVILFSTIIHFSLYCKTLFTIQGHRALVHLLRWWYISRPTNIHTWLLADTHTRTCTHARTHKTVAPHFWANGNDRRRPCQPKPQAERQRFRVCVMHICTFHRWVTTENSSFQTDNTICGTEGLGQVKRNQGTSQISTAGKKKALKSANKLIHAFTIMLEIAYKRDQIPHFLKSALKSLTISHPLITSMNLKYSSVFVWLDVCERRITLLHFVIPC